MFTCMIDEVCITSSTVIECLLASLQLYLLMNQYHPISVYRYSVCGAQLMSLHSSFILQLQPHPSNPNILCLVDTVSGGTGGHLYTTQCKHTFVCLA